MRYFRTVHSWIIGLCSILALFLLYMFWHWMIERTEVPSGEYLVVIHKWGKDLPEGQIIAPDDSCKGVMLEPLKEGRHFLNPIFWTYERHKMVHVPTGKCLVVTRKYGKDISKERLEQGDILAREGERGIVPEVLMPGYYRLNPYAYDWKLVDAIEIAVDQVGVMTLKVGKDPRGLPAQPDVPRYVVPEGYRGIQEKPVRPGTYYLNPYVALLIPVEVRNHRVELTDIEFPSRDGFLLKPHVMVEYRVVPEMAPEVLVRLTDEGILHQKDGTEAEIRENEALQKIILPHIRGYARLKGSGFDAKDFIVTGTGREDKRAINSREKLQVDLFEAIRPRCQRSGIDILAVKLANMVPPPELTKQISERDLARVEQEKNQVQLGRYKTEQDLKAAEALTERAKMTKEAETRLAQAKKKAEQRKQVEELRLKQELVNAQLRLEASQQRAEAVLATGKADAAVILLQNEAEVAGLRKAVQSFPSVNHFAQYQMMSRLAPSLTEIFASDEGDFARLFTTYMTQPTTTTTQPVKTSPTNLGPPMPPAR